MAITFDATSSASDVTNGDTSMSWSHTCTGTNRLLVLGGFIGPDATLNITGVTYNGVSLTKVRQDFASLPNIRTSIWYLMAPASGINTITVTFSAALNSISGHGSMGVATSFAGAHQSAALDVSGTTTGNGVTSSTISLTTAANAWIVDMIANIFNNTMTAGGSQVQTAQASVSSNGNIERVASSYLGPVTGLNSMSWTFASDYFVASAASFIPAAAAPSVNVDSWYNHTSQPFPETTKVVSY